MECRVLESGVCTITQEFKSSHQAIDLVKEGYQLDNIVAHSDGTVVQVISNCNANTPNDSNNPGNMVKIDHGNGYYTRYLHLAYGTVKVHVGDKVKKGQVLGYMGNTGHSFGGHLHFEVWEGSERINPQIYLSDDLPHTNTSETIHKYKVGDTVTINGVYVSSTSDTRLTPAITKGKITNIIEGARNPYLLENGAIGWVNDDCIVSNVETITYMTVTNCSWLNLRVTASYGNNIYKSVKAGTQVEYHGMYDGWARIKYEGQTLYCGKSYLK